MLDENQVIRKLKSVSKVIFVYGNIDGNEIRYGKKDFKNPSLILKSKGIL